MANTAEPDLIKITEVFLIPSSFLVAALGTADSNPHRAGVSLVGLVVSVLWWVCSREAMAERRVLLAAGEIMSHSRRIRVMASLPLLFVAVWCVSLVMHVMLWNQPLGH